MSKTWSLCTSFNTILHYTTTTTTATTPTKPITKSTTTLHYTALITVHHKKVQYATFRYSPLRYTTLSYTTLHMTQLQLQHTTTTTTTTTPHHTTPHYTNYTTLHFPAPHSIKPLSTTNTTITTTHYTNYTTLQSLDTCKCNCPTLIDSSLLCTTATTPPHYNYSSCGWGGRPGEHCNRCNRSEQYNSNHLSVHQWIRSAIRDSHQATSPTGVLLLKLPPSPCAVLLVWFWYTITTVTAYNCKNLSKRRIHGQQSSI